MAIFDFLKKGKKEQEEESLKHIVPPLPRPKIEEIPSFPFEKEELLPPIKPIKLDIRPLGEKPAPRPPLPQPKKEFEKFIPRPSMPERPMPRPIRVREEVVIERPAFETEIRPEPETIHPMPERSALVPRKTHAVRTSDNIPYVRVYKFKEAVEDLNQIAKSLKKIPTKLKTKKIEDAYEGFEKSLEVVMKNIDSIERGIFE